MSSFKIKSYAKVNLALNVISKKTKLHKIESIVSFINFHDLIHLKYIKEKNHKILRFTEKPLGDGSLINGGFFVLSPNVLSRLTGDDCVWEQEPLRGLAEDGNLMAYTHKGFWQPMDTLREMIYLQKLWDSGKAPWKTW